MNWSLGQITSRSETNGVLWCFTGLLLRASAVLAVNHLKPLIKVQTVRKQMMLIWFKHTWRRQHSYHSHSQNKKQTIDATNHFLHVSCHRLDSATQSIVLSNNLWVLLLPEPWKTTETLIHFTSDAVAMATACKWLGGLFGCKSVRAAAERWADTVYHMLTQFNSKLNRVRKNFRKLNKHIAVVWDVILEDRQNKFYRYITFTWAYTLITFMYKTTEANLHSFNHTITPDGFDFGLFWGMSPGILEVGGDGGATLPPKGSGLSTQDKKWIKQLNKS